MQHGTPTYPRLAHDMARARLPPLACASHHKIPTKFQVISVHKGIVLGLS